MTTKHITVLTPCFNEEENVGPLYEAVRDVFARLPQYRYSHLFIDNASRDRTVDILRGIAATDPHVKVIVNTRNFGHIRSPYHGLLEAEGDAVIGMVADFQDPPEMIPQLIAKWEEGAKLVLCVKSGSHETKAMFWLRSRYYNTLSSIAEVDIVRNATGFGLYDREVLEAVRRISDPYPFFRGQLAEVGYEPALIPYQQPARQRGITSQNFYSLYDMAFLGLVNHSKVPLRLAALLGFLMAGLSLLAGFGYLAAKLLFWNSFSLGIAPILIGFFFMSAIQMIFVGILGEYVGFIYTQVKNRPHVFERERINL
ncbi:MAG: glycosyltransferase family 2 protein [Gemmatimonadota bacterium]|nr:glycosyltransferase family 2 protein [Gemmatimonadota bacterium]